MMASPPADDESEFARKLSKPVSSLISLSFQFNHDCCHGPHDGECLTLNIRPLIPFKLIDDWNLVARTVLPVVQQSKTSFNDGDHFVGGASRSSFSLPNR